MNLIEEVGPFLNVLAAIITFIEAVDPNAEKNPAVVKLQGFIDELKKLNNEL